MIDPAVKFVLLTKLDDLVEYADAHGINFELIRKPQKPLATGNHRPTVNFWLKREHTRPE
jgi:hypothetical protein